MRVRVVLPVTDMAAAICAGGPAVGEVPEQFEVTAVEARDPVGARCGLVRTRAPTPSSTDGRGAGKRTRTGSRLEPTRGQSEGQRWTAELDEILSTHGHPSSVPRDVRRVSAPLLAPRPARITA